MPTLRRFIIALCTVIFAAAGHAAAQEIPQPLLGNCCSCTGAIHDEAGAGLDTIRVATRVVPVSFMNPFDDGFTLELVSGAVPVFSASLAPGEMDENVFGRRWTWHDPNARSTGGFSRVLVQEMTGGLGGFLIHVYAYGDLSTATDPSMTIRIAIGGDSFFDTSLWTVRNNGFRHGFW